MKQYIKYLLFFILGFFVSKLWYQKKRIQNQKEEIQVIVNGVKNLSKLVVSQGNFSQMYNYSDSKKYFYDVFSFDKKIMLSVNAKVEVGYDLAKMDIQIDSVGKKIIINSIPTEEVVVSPDIKYFDLQQSQFNSFTRQELNALNQKSIKKIKETVQVTTLKTEAKTRLFQELSKLYQLSAVFGWQVVDNTKSKILTDFKTLKD